MISLRHVASATDAPRPCSRCGNILQVHRRSRYLGLTCYCPGSPWWTRAIDCHLPMVDPYDRSDNTNWFDSIKGTWL